MALFLFLFFYLFLDLESMNFIKRLKREKFYLSSQSFEIWLSIRDVKIRNKNFTSFFSKIMHARPKKRRDM